MMAIGDRVKECIDKVNQGDYENALIQLSIAFDGTAKRAYPQEKKVSRRFMRFLRDSQDIITYFTFNGTIFVDCVFDGFTFEKVFYEVLRCGLLHEGSIPDEIQFVDQIMWGRPNGKWTLPRNYVLGGLLAVIAAPTNARERIPEHYAVNVCRNRFAVNQLWGRIDFIRNIIAAPPMPPQSAPLISP